MDPISQGAVGALAAQSLTNKKFDKTLKKKAWIIGALAGMFPDVDNLISSPSSVLSFNEYHRHFTHSISFIPIGALIATAILCLSKRYREQWKWVYVACFLGYGSHGVLDAFTTYGTLLYWPFSDFRVSWDILPIVDPIITIALCFFVYFANRSLSVILPKIGLLILVFYTLFAYSNKTSVAETQQALLDHRKHIPDKTRITPAPGLPIVWRAFYEYQGKQFSDVVRTPFFRENQIIVGGSAPLFSVSNLPFAIEDMDLFQSRLDRFKWFSDQWLVSPKDDPSFIGDGRYSMSYGNPRPMWGIRVLPSGMTQWESQRDQTPNAISTLWSTLLGNNPDLVNESEVLGKNK